MQRSSGRIVDMTINRNGIAEIDRHGAVEVSRISSSAFGGSTFGIRGRLSHITARMISTTDEVLTSPRKYMPNIKLKTRTTSKTRGRATDPQETILHTYD